MKGIAFITLASLSLVGCKKNKEEPKEAPKEPTAPNAGSAPAPVAKDDCPATYTKVANPGFCIKLPAEYTLGEITGTPPEPIEINFPKDESSMDGLTVRASSTDTLESKRESYDGYTNDKNEVKEKGDLLGGKGRYFLSSVKGEPGATMGVYVQAGKFLIICEGASNGTPEQMKPKLDICKTITPIGG